MTYNFEFCYCFSFRSEDFLNSIKNLILLLQFEGVLLCCTGEEEKLQGGCCKII